MATNKKFNPVTYPYARCREQHVWEFHDGAIDQKNKLAYRIQKCANCPTRRHTIFSTRPGAEGEIESRTYRYPTDYQVKGGLDRFDLGRVRYHNFLQELAARQGKK
jgi:hypothetical protein